MRKRLLVAPMLLLVAACGGGTTGAQRSPDAVTPTPAAAATSPGAGLQQFAGRWRIEIQDLRATGTGNYANVTASVSGDRLLIEAGVIGAGGRVRSDLATLIGEHSMTCRPDMCSAALELAIVPAGSGYRVVHAANLTPITAGAGCGTPTADAGVIKDLTARSFKYVAGLTVAEQRGCYHVVWTYVATKVS